MAVCRDCHRKKIDINIVDALHQRAEENRTTLKAIDNIQLPTGTFRKKESVLN